MPRITYTCAKCSTFSWMASSSSRSFKELLYASQSISQGVVYIMDAKVVKVISVQSQEKRFIILVKEVLPNYEYGQKFKAVIEGEIAKQLETFSPQTGDRLAFYEPYIFINTSYQSEDNIAAWKQPKYLLQIGCGERSLMWGAKKQKVMAEDDKCLKRTKSPEKRGHYGVATTSKQLNVEVLQGSSVSGKSTTTNGGKPNSDDNAKKQSGDGGKALPETRQKPMIQLPHKPQIPSNTKRLNPHYKYRTIGSIKSSSPTSDMERVNIFGVVSDIMKPVSTTKNNKYTMICTLMDDSENGVIKFHFFTQEDTIIKQIEPGDVLRLHRAKFELYHDEIDGRVFFSQDLVIFKTHSSDIPPISIAKNTIIADEDKNRVEALKRWYNEYDQDLNNTVSLSNINKSGKYRILCKVLMTELIEEQNKVKLRVTDGTALKTLVPALPLQRYKKGKVDHIVTEIVVNNKSDQYTKLKVGDIVFFRNIEAVQLGTNPQWQLMIYGQVEPQIVDKKDPRAVDIEKNIEKYKGNCMNNDDEVKDNNTHVGNNKHAIVTESVSNKQNNLLDSSEHENEICARTRLQKNKQQNSAVKSHVNPSAMLCENKSCAKPKVSRKTKDNCNSENTGRKQLFTPNYMTDLSDAATDETSDNLETFTPSANKQPDEDVVNPANTSFNDIVEKVKTKYCSRRVSGEPSVTQVSEDPNCRSSSKRGKETSKDNTKVPVVMLEKVSEKDFRQHSVRKRGINVTECQEDLLDASTVYNVSYQEEMLDRTNKKTRLESISTEERNLKDVTDIDQELESRGHKVSNWLFHPGNKIAASQQDDVINDEFEVAVIKQILCCGKESPDMSKYVTALCFRMQVFLLEVIPDPSMNAFDLVSGYCHTGCHQLFLFTKIFWRHVGENSIPFCPECIKQEQERELELMLIMELHVMDVNGRHTTLLAVRDQAEQFLNCTVSDFVKDSVIRKSRVQLLTDYTTQTTLRCDYTPLLDIAVTPIGRLLCLVNSTLKLPTSL